MRLIDADELKKKLTPIKLFGGAYCKAITEKDIDNAPTADDWQKFSDELWKNAYKEGYKQAIIDGKTNFSRPQGEWYYNNQNGWHCSICHKSVKDMPTVMGKADFDYCPNCGADMRGDKE